MPEWLGKSRGNKSGYRIFVAICNTFGVKPAYALLRFVALYYFFGSPVSSRRLYRYFRQHHGYGKLKALKSIYVNYYRFGQTLLDKIVVMAGIENRFTYHFDGEENLLAIANGGRGGILLSAHIGNWEVAGHFLQRLNTSIHVVMFDGEHGQIKDYLSQVTGKRKFNVIVVRNDLSHVYAIGEALQKNELVCMHADRFVDGNKTRSCNFLGKEALFPVGPFVLAASFDVPVSIVFAFKETSDHYHFLGSAPITRNETESKSDYRERLTGIFLREMENKVKTYPEQWFNYYDFWTR
jgi:predicted LPLAT superfamily acyltransferase